VGAGDRVGIFMPMVPETVAAVLAVAKLGAVFLPLFSGYGAPAVSTRLSDGGAVALITADGCFRRGKQVDMLSVAREAVAADEAVQTVVAVPRLGTELDGDVVPWPAIGASTDFAEVDSEHPLFIA